MSSPSDLRYTDTHEWIRLEGEIATLGITAYAVNELTDITYVEMQEVGTSFDAGEPIGEVESVKATNDIYSPVAGEIVEVNTSLADDPSLVNTDSYSGGWLVKIRLSGASSVDSLMDAEAYDAKYAIA